METLGSAFSMPQQAAGSLNGAGGQVVLDLRALTAEAFGRSGLRRFAVGQPGAAQANGCQFPGVAGTAAAPATRTGLLGLPVFVAVDLGAATNPATGATAAGVSLLDPLVTVAMPFNVVKTSITGRRGTVKEFIAQDDYAVSIRTILATDPLAPGRTAYPLAQVQALRDLLALGVALPVSGWLSDVWGIHSLVVLNARFEPLPGFTNLQAVELDCLSDDPIELSL